MSLRCYEKFEEKLTCCLENDRKNLLNFHQSMRRSQNWESDEILLSTVEKFEGKLTCAFKNDMKNLANFHKLKNSELILQSKMAELDQNEN